MQIFIRGLSRNYVLNLEKEEDLRAAIIEREGTKDITLFAGGRPLEACAFSLKEPVTLDVSLKLRGGKVHGRLNQAGKIRGLTPKVEPQEKKKKKTGRARKRDQYNKRFVNVAPVATAVGTGGRGKGPNANNF